MKLIRRSIPEEERIIGSGIIFNKIIALEEYKRCKEIFIYLSFGAEVITEDFINFALNEGKTVALPYITQNKGEMVFIKINSLSGLIENSYGIKEPVYDEKNIVTPTESALFIAPGLAFSKEGRRLGYGGGYYDRYLSKYKTLCNIGVCFKQQLIKNVPTDIYDIQLDKIITD